MKFKRLKIPILRLTSITAAASMLLSVMAPAAEAAVTTLLAPKPGEKVSARNVEVSVGYNTQSGLKATEIQLWIDGKRLASKVLVNPVNRGVTSFWWDPAKYSPGLHNIAVKVYAGDRLVGTARGSATVGKIPYDLAAPAVHFSNLKPGQVLSGKTSIKIASADDSGDAPIVSLMVDNSLKMLSNTHPCSYDLDTTQFSDGEHEIRLMAFDTSGNKSEGAVLNVSFKNDIKQMPVALSKPVAQPTKIAASEDDYAVRIPPVESLPIASTSAAARIDTAKRTPESAPARPVAANPKAAKHGSQTRMALAPVVPMPVQNLQIAALPTELPPVSIAKSVQQISEPKIPTFVVPVQPIQAAPKAESPFVTPEPRPNQPPRVTIASPAIAVPMPSLEPVIAPEKIAAAPASTPKTVDKPFRVAMRLSTEVGEKPVAAIERPATVKKDKTAKLEKRTIPVSGKMKLRDLVEDLGGVLFWDPASRSVTAQVSGLKIEMKIGSQLMKVNGTNVGIERAPTLVDGRTVIDVGIYHLACHVAATDDNMAMGSM